MRFEDMQRYLAPAVSGNVVIEHDGDRVRMLIDGAAVMEDNIHGRATHQPFLDNAHGDVLVAGLGIGFILIPILKSKDVTSVTVVEINEDVITLVREKLRRNLYKLTVVNDDILTWDPEPGQLFDTIYFDIWPSAEGVDTEVALLKGRAVPWARQGAWIAAWPDFAPRVPV